ncbi:hypothetical protein NP233_g8502 [Leucocoprinus birnbaumii]|uniref:Defective in cullin neddylation protein n=1 Tax=Leucocoprinus birnbaumii TaxID=56174 RepID=A0AAD5YN37_9AGAR|nr:hypothetical protein NP233_g8502 [Leucocoprinus birnbaumii]
MPPKVNHPPGSGGLLELTIFALSGQRKHNEDNAKEPTRSTRSSTRTKAASVKNDSTEAASTKTAAKRATKASSSKNQVEDHEDSAEQQPAKKARTSKATGKGKKQTKSAAAPSDEEHKVKQSKSSSSTHVETHSANPKAPPPPEAPVIPPADDAPYTPQRALALFESYADPDEPNVIGPEGFEKLCSESALSMEGSVPLILAWQMNAKEMAKISKEEWVNGTRDLRISSPKHLATALTDLENLLVFGKPPIKKAKSDPYDRTKYWHYAANTKEAFRKLYLYCFMLVKPPSSKNIEMETAVAFWSVLLGPKYPLMRDVLEYINEKGTYRAANKDLWNMMLEFCETVNPNLDNFEADGAWPTLLDEFASWKKAKSEA